MWADLWALPQAAAWEHLSLQRMVATYVQDSLDVAALRRTLNETGEAPAQYSSLKSRIDKLAQELGLTPTGLLKNRWEIVADEVAEKRDEQPAPAAAPAAPRRRLKVAGSP